MNKLNEIYLTIKMKPLLELNSYYMHHMLEHTLVVDSILLDMSVDHMLVVDPLDWEVVLEVDNFDIEEHTVTDNLGPEPHTIAADKLDKLVLMLDILKRIFIIAYQFRTIITIFTLLFTHDDTLR